MLLTLALMTTLIGCFLVYSTNRHQRLLLAGLPRAARYFGYFLSLLSLVLWLANYSSGAGFFVWLTLSMAALICLPFCSLLLTGSANEK